MESFPTACVSSTIGAEQGHGLNRFPELWAIQGLTCSPLAIHLSQLLILNGNLISPFFQLPFLGL